ncbi:MAG: MarR family transcriptional regulator [Desulfobacterales bacterium]|nr:MarR family transcriptional regulator [Desulfobacterales bacterium]
MIKTYEECICFLFAKANQKAQSTMKRRLKPYKLTGVQILILEALWEEDGQTAGEIARRVSLDNATLSGVLDRLTDSGWVLKETDHQDKRALKVRLSSKALATKGELLEVREEVNHEILHSLAPEEVRLFKRFLAEVR